MNKSILLSAGIVLLGVFSQGMASRHAGVAGQGGQIAVVKSQWRQVHSDVSIPLFNSISCDGHVNLTLIPGSKGRKQHMHIVVGKWQAVNVSVKNHTLYIDEKDLRFKLAKAARVRLPVGILQQLSVTGNSSVDAQGIHTHLLALNADTVGTVNLTGDISVAQIRAARQAQVKMRWVDSDDLSVKTYDQSHVNLAGVANNLTVRSTQNSQFDGQYLRGKKIMAQGSSNSQLKLLATDTLRAFASGHSQIYYYKNPQHITKRSEHFANILQAAWRG